MELPSLESFEKALLGYYVKLNSSLNRTIVEAKRAQNQAPRSRNIRYSSNKEERNRCLEILEVLKTKLHEKIINHIPKHPIYQNTKVKNFFKTLILTS